MTAGEHLMRSVSSCRDGQRWRPDEALRKRGDSLGRCVRPPKSGIGAPILGEPPMQLAVQRLASAGMPICGRAAIAYGPAQPMIGVAVFVIFESVQHCEIEWHNTAARQSPPAA